MTMAKEIKLDGISEPIRHSLRQTRPLALRLDVALETRD